MAHRMGLSKATVVEAAAKLVEEEGLAQLSLGRLAERLGVRTPSLYNHIESLAALKRELGLYCLRELIQRFTRATVGKSRSEAIFAFANAYRSYAREAPGCYALTLQAPAPDDLEALKIARQTVEVGQAVLAPYGLSEEAMIHAIRGLRSIIQGFVSLEAAGGFGLPVDLEASFHWLIKLFIAGLSQSEIAQKQNSPITEDSR